MTRRERLEAGRARELAKALRPPAPASDLAEATGELIERVRRGGDAALAEHARSFGAPGFGVEMIVVPPDEWDAAAERLPERLRAAILAAAEQVRVYATQLRPSDVEARLPHGQRIVSRVVPVGAVGAYVPGGRAAYPSSLVMAAVPAQVAGVGRVAVASPPGPDGRISDAILGAAALLDVDEVYALGGAAAVAALAYGTSSVPPVDVIVGPGNSWVQEAKRQVVGRVGIDGIAGPSEVLIVADKDADPRAVAADLLAQAEHGDDSPAILATDSERQADAVAELVRSGPAAPGPITIVLCATMDDAVELAQEFAPEHLEIQAHGAEGLARRVTTAGAVFLGHYGATAFGDYVAGSNHVLPTGGAGRYASALGPDTFMRRMSVIEMSSEAVEALTPHLAALAEAEGFPLHRASAELRSSR
ncbi:MAG: histidinol dehydrogenase [Miltoncostaeaceae bacterium]